jgi:hypothetical protein
VSAARNVQMDVIRPLNVEAVKASMVEHQRLLESILDPSDWQGKPDQKGSFVKKSGWRKIALAYNLTIENAGETVERDQFGKPLRATFTSRAIAPNGRGVESTGHCAYAESRFSGPNGNESKLENDMRATAETRAKNRAISDLIGMGKVSAEEAESGGGGAPAGLPHGPDTTTEERQQTGRAIEYLLPGTAPEVAAKIMVEHGGYFPKPASMALLALAKAVRAAHAPGAPAEDALTPAQEAELARQAAGAGVSLDGTGVSPPEPEEPPIVDAVVVPDTPAAGKPNEDYHEPPALEGMKRSGIPTGIDGPDGDITF